MPESDEALKYIVRRPDLLKLCLRSSGYAPSLSEDPMLPRYLLPCSKEAEIPMQAGESSANESADDAPLAEREPPMLSVEQDNWEGDSAVGGVHSYAYASCSIVNHHGREEHGI